MKNQTINLDSVIIYCTNCATPTSHARRGQDVVCQECDSIQFSLHEKPTEYNRVCDQCGRGFKSKEVHQTSCPACNPILPSSSVKPNQTATSNRDDVGIESHSITVY